LSPPCPGYSISKNQKNHALPGIRQVQLLKIPFGHATVRGYLVRNNSHFSLFPIEEILASTMKTAFILASVIAGASAFAPLSQQSKVSTALNLDATKEIGVQAPLGFHDPIGVLGPDPTNVDDAAFARKRWVELKHGRVAMLAVVGYIATYAGLRFPGAEDIPSGFAALSEVPGMVWAQMVATWAMMEAANQDQSLSPWGTGDGPTKAEFKGDFRNGALDFGWDSKSDMWKKNKRSIELNQGRAAMMGITGLMVHDLLGNVDKLLPPSL
jgi:hypothetical protein